MPLKPVIIFSAFIFVSLFASGQQNVSAYKQKEYDDSVKCEKLFEWEKGIEHIDYEYYNSTPLSELEINRDSILNLQFIRSCKELQEILPYYKGYPESFVNSVYAIDLNGDSAKDFLYYGPSGGQPLMTKIFINMGDFYQEVFSGVEVISEYKFIKNRLSSFTLYCPGCCADPQDLNFYYRVKYTNNEPTFIRLKTIGYLNKTQKPEAMVEENIAFSVASDSAVLRNVCFIFDETPCYPIYFSGTAIARYGKGSTGYLLGTKNQEGAEWVYVIMDVNPGKKHSYYPSFTEQPTHIKGWMLKSDTDIK